MKERVVVTGMGATIPKAKNINELWNNIKKQKTCLTFNESMNKVVGQVIAKNTQKKFEYMLRNAMDQICAKPLLKDSNKEVVSLIFGCSIGDTDSIHLNAIAGEYNRENKHMYINELLFEYSKTLQISGRVSIVASACSSSSIAMNTAYNLIKNGKSDAVYVVGIDNIASEIGLTSFDSLGVLSKKNDANDAMTPFSDESSGFVISDGCGVILMESLKYANKNARKIYAEITGIGVSCDAYHILTPEINGEGAVRAMQGALSDSKLKPVDISYVNAHGTGTQANDIPELDAIEAVFRNEKNTYVCSTKSLTGHMLGASGVIETIISIMSLNENIIPSTASLKKSLVRTGVTLNKDNIYMPIKYVMNNTLAFGGQNVSIIIKKYEQ